MPQDYPTIEAAHRWIRGDWQIAPWMLGRVPRARGLGAQSPECHQSMADFQQFAAQPGPNSASMLLLLFGWLTSRLPVSGACWWA